MNLSTAKLSRTTLTLAAILLLGLCLRTYDLGNESIWVDEAISIAWAKLDLSQIMKKTARDVHPPLHAIILHFWVDLFGESEFPARFPSAIFGFVAIFMIYKVGSLIFDEQTGILSSLILGLSVFHIYYSQEARMYSLLSVMTLFSMYFFIKLLKEKSIIASVGYTLSGILLMYTHYFGLFIIASQNAYIFTLFLLSEKVHKPRLKRWLLLQFILILVFAPWIIILIKQTLQVQSGRFLGWVLVPSIWSIIRSFELYSGSYLLLFLFLALSLVSVVNCKKVKGNVTRKCSPVPVEGDRPSSTLSDAGGIYLLLVWLLTPIIVPFVISKFSAPIYYYRFTIGASLAFYLLVAKGIRDISNNYVKFVTVGLIVGLSLATVLECYAQVNKYRWREAVNYLEGNARSGDLVLFSPQFNRIPFDYYSRRTDLTEQPFPGRGKKVDEESIKQLASIVEGHDRVWVILAHDVRQELSKKKLRESYRLSDYKSYVHTKRFSSKEHGIIELYLFEAK